MLSADDLVAIIRPVKERADDDAWRAALARLGGGADPAPAAFDDYAAKVKRSKTVPQYADLIGQKDRTAWDWIATGKIVSFKTPGGRRLIDPADNPDQSA